MSDLGTAIEHDDDRHHAHRDRLTHPKFQIEERTGMINDCDHNRDRDDDVPHDPDRHCRFGAEARNVECRRTFHLVGIF